MLIETVHKHRTLLSIVVFGPIIIAFVFWGAYSGGGAGSNQAGYGENPVAVVGNGVVTAMEFRNALTNERQRRAQYGQDVSMEQLVADGTAERVLTGLVNRQLLAQQSAGLELEIDEEYLQERLKEFPDFQNEEGEFDPALWNDFVDSSQDWKSIYQMVENQVQQRVFVDSIVASARVMDSELKREFAREQTKVGLRYAALEPAIEPTEEQLRAQYDKAPEAYQLPAKRKVLTAAISVEAPKPDMVDDLVRRARSGEDFAELVKAHSDGPRASEGGEIGWLKEQETTPEHLLPVFKLEAGRVSDAVKGPGGYYILKVEEERTDEAGAREVRVRQILIRPELEPAKREELEKQAADLAEKAKQAGGLEAAASEAGVEVFEVGPFSPMDTAIPGVPREDSAPFRMAAVKLEEGAVSDVIEARSNLYVMQVAEVLPPEPQPFEEVRDKVKEDVVREIQQSEEYKQKVAALADEVSEKVDSLDAIQGAFPDLDIEIKECAPFTAEDYDFSSGPPWNPREVFSTMAGAEKGQMVGPITDFMGTTYFVELTQRVEPEPSELDALWEEEKESRREMALARAQQGRLEDYLLDLRNRGSWQLNQQEFLSVVGLGQEETAPEDAAGEDGEAAPEAPAGSEPSSEPDTAPEAEPAAQ